MISDVHGNLEALNAVLADISRRHAESGSGRKPKILFLGDAAGYGPDPNACIDMIQKRTVQGVAGNHDWAVLGLTEITYFNPNAKAAIRWTDENLTPGSRSILEKLPLVKRMQKDNIFLVHSSPYEPEEWHYLLNFSDAQVNFEHFSERICLIGHSHLPFVMERKPAGEITASKGGAKLDASCRYIINAGSVGQPRDGDPRACYLLLNDEQAEFVRVPYDIEITQQKMSEAGLPPPLIERLSRGL